MKCVGAGGGTHTLIQPFIVGSPSCSSIRSRYMKRAKLDVSVGVWVCDDAAVSSKRCSQSHFTHTGYTHVHTFETVTALPLLCSSAASSPHRTAFAVLCTHASTASTRTTASTPL